ncbi:hypothetical protein AB0H71_33230 [Nocardia sp. NPDC050697]|uniref:WXG100 family type VII secretion target n=1 Tax=Nocardia sp. NPDC050697 TaxID=3155158 RepID=UPI003411D66F
MSGKPIHVNFSAADAATGTVGSLVAAMETNTANLRKIYQQLLQEFQGSGGTGYETVMANFDSKLTAYDGSVNNVKAKLVQNVNTGGIHHETDIAQGNRFLGV